MKTSKTKPKTELSKLLEKFGDLTYEKIKYERMLRDVNTRWNALGVQIEKLKKQKE